MGEKQVVASPRKVIGFQNSAISYQDRQAVRAIIQNKTTNNIALIYISKGNYYKLPGGGIEEGEKDHRASVSREILEETGCTIVTDEVRLVGTSEEWRNDLHQISYCYAAILDEDTGRPELTELETQEGLTHGWYPLDQAVELMRGVEPTSELGQFIKERDLFFLVTFAESEGSSG